MSDLSSLIERLEKLDGPDREVDLAIGELWPEPRPFSMSIAQQRGGKPPVFRFTASIDAIVALIGKVLPGQWWQISGNCDGSGSVACIGDNWAYRAPTPAIALCIALLQAIKEREGET